MNEEAIKKFKLTFFDRFKSRPILTSFENPTFNQRIKIVRDPKYSKIVSAPPSFSLNYQEQTMIERNDEIKKLIDEFVSKVRVYAPFDRYENIKEMVDHTIIRKGFLSMTWKERLKLFTQCKVGRSYGDEIITLNSKYTLFHEMLHSITTVGYRTNYNTGKVEHNFYTGFYQYTEIENAQGETIEEYRFGRGLNEGMTEKIMKDIFGKAESYNYERKICDVLELIIGEKTLRHAYFKADLESVMNKLASTEEEKEEFKRFIKYLDYVNSVNNNFNILIPHVRKNIKIAKEAISEYLTKVFSKYLMNSFEFKMSIKLNDKTIKEMQEFEIKKFYKAMSDIGSKNILRTLRSHIKEYEKQEKQERSR